MVGISSVAGRDGVIGLGEIKHDRGIMEGYKRVGDTSCLPPTRTITADLEKAEKIHNRIHNAQSLTEASVRRAYGVLLSDGLTATSGGFINTQA